MKFEIDKKTAADVKMIGMQALKAIVFTSSLILASGAFAQTPDLANTDTKVCGFLGNINSLLTMGSVAVVTIAVIVAGYQIAFAHKRISEVSPILIGGVLIGAAGQVANMIIGDRGSNTCKGDVTTGLIQLIQYYA
ncbi:MULTISPECIES: TrbC/VirB2 family protein [Xanthomonas]|uniref:TrbC/VirB2 family protein n=1 Tax=Xanthomonas TaxID=338 RepID=UPI000E1F11B5|nr:MULTISPECIES: TrbC/VirB2 family protein [Xanthomonas]MCC5068334.1 TrbC/VirB2 family protein [Xanthomonas campestris]MCC5072299.1 TrbC/VirB2 family protein [Xanthomonas campestris pv. plantaginis]MCC5085320.1 TrbC/VirB2 family protein [Xanthomonas campestris]MEB2184423.1 TrbC/VirB2 family protein [Xanthomonas campestris pv. campestris]